MKINLVKQYGQLLAMSDEEPKKRGRKKLKKAVDDFVNFLDQNNATIEISKTRSADAEEYLEEELLLLDQKAV